MAKDDANIAELQDLREDPRKFFLKYQTAIRVIVKRFIATELFDPSEFEDTVQHLSGFLWERIPTIRAQYNGTSLLRTYVSDILRHECLRIYRDSGRRPKTVRLNSLGSVSEVETERGTHIREYVDMLGVALSLYGDGKPKIILCLKAFYKIPLDRPEILAYWPKCPRKLLETTITRLGGEYFERRETEVFDFLHPLIAKRERLGSTPQSLRRWTAEQIVQITRLLNGNPPTANIDRISLGTLFEYYAAPKSLETL